MLLAIVLPLYQLLFISHCTLISALPAANTLTGNAVTIPVQAPIARTQTRIRLGTGECWTGEACTWATRGGGFIIEAWRIIIIRVAVGRFIRRDSGRNVDANRRIG